MPAQPSRQSLSELAAKVLDQLAVSAWLPAGVLVVLGTAVGSLRVAKGDWSRAIASLAALSFSALLLLVIAIVLATVLTQAFQFEAIRLLEGYWGPGRIRQSLSEAFCRRQTRRRDRLWSQLATLEDQAVRTAVSNMRDEGVDARIAELVWRIQQGELRAEDLSSDERADFDRHPWQDYAPPSALRSLDSLVAVARRYPESDGAVRPTKLGNTLRSFEDPIEAQIGRPIESFVQDVFATLPVDLQDEHDQLRGRLDLYCSLVAVFVLIGLFGAALLSSVDAVDAIGAGVIALALSWLSYRAAVTSARSYGSLLQSIADLSTAVTESRRPLLQRFFRTSFIRRFG